MKSIKLGVYFFLFLFVAPLSSIAQKDYPLDINYYNFIHYDKNKLQFPGDSSDFERFFYKMDTLMLLGEGKLSIVHIGGSHIQADIYSGRTRERLQTFLPAMNGGRGSVFPYRVSKTNGPSSYKVSYSGSWSACRNVELKKNCNLGLLGITASTSNLNSEISIQLRSDSLVSYYFDKIRIFHSTESNSYKPYIDSSVVIDIETNTKLGYTIFYLNKEYNNFNLKLKKDSTIQNQFELYGISLENEDPGFVYHSAGINGASFPSFLRCNLLKKHLKALNPDMVILSLGTNDAYTTLFKPEFYKSNYEKMIEIIRNAVPKAAILNTVANDSYLFKRYPNKNTKLASDVIYEVSKKHNCGVWNFYEVMGGFNSSSIWYKENLMVKDRIHFNLQGYLLKGDLFFNAIIKAYDNHLKHIN